MNITYASGKKVKLKVGDKNFSRPISGMGYVQPIGTLLKKGDAFKKDDILTFNTNYFEKDWFDESKLVYKNSSTAIVALAESDGTYEDSHIVTQSGANKLVTEIVKVTSNVISVDMAIADVVEVGSKVDSDVPLFTAFQNFKSGDLDKDSIKFLKENTKLAIKSPYKGTVVAIECFYNAEEEDMSDSVKEFIHNINALMSSNLNKNVTGKVGGEYSINGVSLQPKNMEIKVYIQNKEPFGTADKAVIGNQLKTTAAEVADYTITTEDGKEVDVVFGDKSQYARIVLSSMLIGTTNLLLNAIAENAVKLYESNN